MRAPKIGPVSREEASFLMGKNMKTLNPIQYRAHRAVLISFTIVLLMSCLNILAGINSFRALRNGNIAEFYVKDGSSRISETEGTKKPAVSVPQSQTAEPAAVNRQADTTAAAPAPAAKTSAGTGASAAAPAASGSKAAPAGVTPAGSGSAARTSAGAAPISPQSPIKTHVVKTGDTFYSLTLDYWGEKWFWPGMYYNNHEYFPNPDFIRPGEKIRILPSPGVLSDLPEQQLHELTLAYLYTYTRYRDLQIPGKTRWVLYAAYRINPDLLNDYGDRITPEDKRILLNDLNNFPVSTD